MEKIKVLLIENETLVRVGVRSILLAEADIEIVGEATTGAEGFELFRRTRADVVLLSLRLPDSCAVDEIEKFLTFAPKAAIVVLASRAGDAEISRSLRSGASGFVCTDVSEAELVKTVRAGAAGRKYVTGDIAVLLSENLGQEQLTRAEQRVLEMIVGGKANKEIAAALGVTENTVKTHVKNIFDKIDVSDRTQAATAAIRRGLVRVDV